MTPVRLAERIPMQKISYTVIKKMIDSKLSSLEIDFILYIGRFQDNSGTASGIFYKDTCQELGCSYQHFYNILRHLEQLSIIEAVRCGNDYDVKLLDNCFEDGEDYKKGYVSLSHGLFSPAFRKMKAGEKLLAIELFRRQDAHFHRTRKLSLCFFTKTLKESFCALLRVTKRVLLGYLKTLKEYFSIGVKDGKVYITAKKCAYSKREDHKTDPELYNEHEIRVICRRNRIDPEAYDANAAADTAKLYAQYAEQAVRAGMDIREAVRECILRSVDKKERTFRAKERRLEPKLVHKLLKLRILPNIPESQTEYDF